MAQFRPGSRDILELGDVRAKVIRLESAMAEQAAMNAQRGQKLVQDSLRADAEVRQCIAALTERLAGGCVGEAPAPAARALFYAAARVAPQLITSTSSWP